MSSTGLTRRRFVHLCSAAAAWLGTPAAAEREPATAYADVALVDRHDIPLTIDTLEPEREYLFFYPYVSTPCFLLRLDQPTRPAALRTADGRDYRWPGGVGAEHRVVAFAAICSHQLTYPSRQVSFIGYRREPVSFFDGRRTIRRASVIQCCAQRSVFDPATGARVLAGPAPQPLAGIALATDDDGALRAFGVYGGTVYRRFFEYFAFQLELEFGSGYREPVTGRAVVMSSEAYTRQWIQC